MVGMLVGATATLPAGYSTFFASINGCPAGWSSVDSVGGYIVVGGNGSFRVGVPLGSLENREHKHDISGVFDLSNINDPLCSWIQCNVGDDACNFAATVGTVAARTTSETAASGLGFAQVIMCMLQETSAVMAILPGGLGFFTPTLGSTSCEELSAASFTKYQPAMGRTLVPGYDVMGSVFLSNNTTPVTPWSNNAHTHTSAQITLRPGSPRQYSLAPGCDFTGLASYQGQPPLHAGLTDTDPASAPEPAPEAGSLAALTLALRNAIGVNNVVQPADALLPVHGMLVCEHIGQQLTPAPLPAGALVFNPNPTQSCSQQELGWAPLPRSYGLQGRVLVGLPSGAPAMALFGGEPIVPPAGRSNNVTLPKHNHDVTSTVSLPGQGLLAQSGLWSPKYMPNNGVQYMGTTTHDSVDMAVAVVSMCVSLGVQPAPDADALAATTSASASASAAPLASLNESPTTSPSAFASAAATRAAAEPIRLRR